MLGIVTDLHHHYLVFASGNRLRTGHTSHVELTAATRDGHSNRKLLILECKIHSHTFKRLTIQSHLSD